jgi:8-oxo-dGTP pyrophosphatase MutT (NUDIX family)
VSGSTPPDGYAGALHADATRLLTAWHAPTPAAEATRRTFLDLLGTAPDAARRDHPGAHLTASVLIVNAARDRVLLCLHGRFNFWVQVGGHCEPEDATLADAALREAREESGLSGLTLHPEPIDLDVHPVRCAAGPSLHYDVRFAAIAPPEATEQVSAESHALGWFPPDALPRPLAGSVDRLVAPALAAVTAIR